MSYLDWCAILCIAGGANVLTDESQLFRVLGKLNLIFASLYIFVYHIVGVGQ